MEEFGRRLSKVRKERKLTQSQLADPLDVQPTLISRWENGTSKPQFDYLVKLGAVLEVSLDALLRDDEDQHNGFEIRNRRLKELCHPVDSLPDRDQEIICHVMDSLIRKERMKIVLDG